MVLNHFHQVSLLIQIVRTSVLLVQLNMLQYQAIGQSQCVPDPIQFALQISKNMLLAKKNVMYQLPSVNLSVIHRVVFQLNSYTPSVKSLL